MICQKKETSFWPYNSFWIIKTTIGNINKQELKAREARVIAKKKRLFPYNSGRKPPFLQDIIPFLILSGQQGQIIFKPKVKLNDRGAFSSCPRFLKAFS